MLHPPPKCMQQIATLIITFAVYVAGIRNTVTGTGTGAGAGDSADAGSVGHALVGNSNLRTNADYESYSTPYHENFRPSQLLSEVTEDISTTNTNAERRQSTSAHDNFRPSQIISFTTSDAQSTPKKYAPSYLEPNYHSQHISKGGPYGLATYNKETQEFAFPSEAVQETAASAIVSANANIQKYLYSNAQSQSVTQQTVIPAQLRTTPIHIYRDPYTNTINTNQRQQNYRATPEPFYQAQYTKGGRPQEYTVQSMLVVGAEQHPPVTYNQQRPPLYATGGAVGGVGAGENKRPGYVFDEQLQPSYNRPVYSNRYEMIASAAPLPPISDYKRRDGETQTERPYFSKVGDAPTTTTKISYDSHDYPPPTYYKQQTSNFQSPQRHEDNTPNYQQSAYATPPATTTLAAQTFDRPELTSSNYANKFGNYLQGVGSGGYAGKGDDVGYYKRPPPHYSNDILYVTPRPTSPLQAPVRPAPPYYPQGNEPIRRPPPFNNNYNQYQLGEIPPPIQQSLPGNGGQMPPLGQYHQTPQHYPSSQHYPPFQSYPPPPNYRPPSPQYQPTPAGGSGGGGLATLASLFTSTQQLAPQFTNLLLGGNGGGGGLLHALTGTRPLGGGSGGGRPPNMQLIKALENIARNDDLECVPKVLCNMIASQTLRGQLPSFVTSPAITNFLAGFPAQSPALIYGRAALLGISGGERSCTQSYGKCPKNEYEILYYLNNHRGGFFKFFSESEETTAPSAAQQSQTQTQSSGSSGGTSLFNLLSVLTGAEPSQTTTTQRPTPPPTVASFDITQGIGNFFSNILSEYISGVEYQRRSSRAKRAIIFEDTRHDSKQPIKFPENTDSDDFHDEEDDEDTQGGVDFVDDQASASSESDEYVDTQGRVVYQSGEHSLHFFPEHDSQLNEERLKDIYLQEVINKFNADRTEKKLKFPAVADIKLEESKAKGEAMDTRIGKVVHFRDETESHKIEGPASDVVSHELDSPGNTIHFEDEQKQHIRRGKKVIFHETKDDASYDEPERQPREQLDEPQSSNRVIFPDHYEQHIRKGKILNKPIQYASHYGEYMQNVDSDQLVVSDNHRPEGIEGNESDSVNDGHDDKKLGPIYYSESSSQQQHNTHNTLVQVYHGNRLHYNRGADTQTGASSSNRYKPSSSPSYSSASSANYINNRYHSSNYKKRPYYSDASSSSSSSPSSNNYDYPNTNYVSNNRYGNRYRTTTTRSPRVSESNHNIYVTNSQGVTTHYITPNGRKVYL